jgi:hypothetical protein
MTNIVEKIRFACCAVALGVLAPTSLSAQKPAPNVIEVVVGNGPFAGTYKPSGGGMEIVCLYVKKDPKPQFAATWRELTPTSKTALNETGVSISNPDAAGAKQGRALVTFGNRDKKQTKYDIEVPASGSGTFTMSRSGGRGDIGFVGKTKDGIQVRITAKCQDIDTM